jgi:hypothetical protein
MVMKDLKEMFRDNKGDEDDEKGNTLFNLVRGESKKRVNFLVTLAEGGMEYVPVRAPSMMIKAVEGKDDYKPRKRKSLVQSLGGGSSSDEEDKVPAKSFLGSPRRASQSSSSSSSDDELDNTNTPSKQKDQQGQRSSRSNKQASAKLSKGLSQKGKSSPAGKKRIKRASSAMSSSAFSPSQGKETWPEDLAFKPKWGGMKSLEIHKDERMMDSEWADDSEKKERVIRDKRIERGGSPPPKDKQGASSWTSSRTLEGQMWGKAKGDDTMSFDALKPWGKDDHSGDCGPDCKFRGKVDEGTGRKDKPSRSPKKKKAKKVAVPSKRTKKTSPPNAEPSLRVQGSPFESSAREEGKEKSVCDEERTFLVKVRPGMTQAEVLFLNNAKGDGWEGPFDLEVPLKDLFEFDLLPLPRQAAMISNLPPGKGKEEASSESGEHRLDKYLTGGRGAGWTEVMSSARETSVERRAQDP